MSNLDSAAIPRLTDLAPVDASQAEEVRTLAGVVASAMMTSSIQTRTSQLMQALDNTLDAEELPTDPIGIVMLLVPLVYADCRAAACARIGIGAEARPHLELWTWVTRHTMNAPPEGLPLTMAGYAAARTGATGLALDCLDRALESTPGLGDALAYRNALNNGLKPEYLRPHYPPR